MVVVGGIGRSGHLAAAPVLWGSLFLVWLKPPKLIEVVTCRRSTSMLQMIDPCLLLAKLFGSQAHLFASAQVASPFVRKKVKSHAKKVKSHA